MTSQSKLRQIKVHDVHIYSFYAVEMSKHSFYIYYGCQSQIEILYFVCQMIDINLRECLYIMFILNQDNIHSTL